MARTALATKKRAETPPPAPPDGYAEAFRDADAAEAELRRAAAPDEWVDERDLAKRLPFSRVTWQNWRRRGQGPRYYKVGKRCLYKWGEVVAWMEAQGTDPKG